MTIWKFILQLTDVQTLWVPEGTVFFHAAEQMGNLTLWGWVDSENPSEERTIAVVGTGNPAPRSYEAQHLGTVLASSGFVWHIFEALKEEA